MQSFGPIAILTMGMLAVLFLAKVARESGRDPTLWGLFSLTVMAGCVALFIVAGPLLRARGTVGLLVWLFASIVIQFLGQGALYLYLHLREGKAPSFVETRLPVFLMDLPDDQPNTRELRFGKAELQIRDDTHSEPRTIAYTDISVAEPDGEVVRVHWQQGAADPEQLTFLVADEELSPKARRAQCVSIAAKLMRLAQGTPPR